MPPARRQLLVCLAVVCGLFLYAYHRSDGTSPSAFSSSSSFAPVSGSSRSRRPHANARPPQIAPSKLVVSLAGFNQFENLYLMNGTVYLLSPPSAVAPYDPKEGGGGGFKDVFGNELLPRNQITSTGLVSEAAYELREATENEITVLPWGERNFLELEESRPLRVEGTTIWLHDSGQMFLDHYYHLWVELLMGAWKSLVLGSDNSEDRLGNTNLITPTRIMFPNANEEDWRDHAGLNGYLLKTIFPSLAYEHRDDFNERILTGKTYLYDKVVLVDRTAGHKGSKCTGPSKWYWKMVGDILDAPAGKHWWQPIRHRLLDTLPVVKTPTVPTITYISRQGHGRSLLDEDHDALVAALESLVKRKGWILETPKMQFMTKDEQFALAARTTVMLGVHGNGLSHQIWMEPTPFSTVIEMYDEGAFCYDYALPAQALGHAHYIAWQSKTIDTHAAMQKVAFTDGFHSREIRASGQMVADLIEKRLEGWKA